MAEDTLTTAGIGKHGVPRLPSVDIDSYNIELKDDDGFLGDRASKGAFRKILDDLRKPLKKNGEDPLGKTPSEEIAKSALDVALTLPSNESVRTAVEAGAGIAVLAAMVVAPAIKAGSLHVGSIAFEPRPFFGLRHKERYRIKAADALLDLIGS